MPGLLVSPDFLTTLWPLWGLEVLTTPLPQAFWSRRVQTMTPGMNREGSTKPGAGQQWSSTGQFAFGVVGVHPAPEQLSHPPWMPAHLGRGPPLPHGMQAGCSQAGDDPAPVTMNFVVAFGGVACVRAPSVTQGV